MRALRLGIRGQMVAVVAGLVALLGALAILQLNVTMRQSVGAELNKLSLSLAGDLAARVADPVLLRNRIEVGRILRDTMANNPDVRYAFVVDGEGRLMAHTFRGGFPRGLLEVHTAADEGAPSVMLLNSSSGLLHDARAPVLGGLAGYVRVGLSEEGLASSLDRLHRLQMLTVALIGLAAILVTYWILTALTSRVRKLVAASQAVGSGNLDVRVDPAADDEIGMLTRAFNEMTRQPQAAKEAVEAKEAARTALLQKLLMAQEEERQHISRELHDQIGQELTGLLVGLGAAASDPAQYPERLVMLRDLAARTLDSVRHLSRDLRPAVLDDMGLVPALRRHVEDFQAIHGIETTLQVVGDEGRRLPPELEITIYRVVQEALTNVARHSGAEHASVVLNLHGPQVGAIVEDDGRGFRPDRRRPGLGLEGMRERAALVGGSITIETCPGGGTTIYFKAPLKEETQHADSDRG